MDESRFVDDLKTAFPFSHGLGIGDDTSVVKAGDYYQLVTKDILIQDVHFRLDDFTLPELALKSLAVNLSDIAAMGGEPQYFYLGLGFPRKLPRGSHTSFFKGVEEGCRRWRVELAGGDFSTSDKMFISITLVGQARQPVYRHTAQTGDLIGITGITGESAIGLKLLLTGDTGTGYFVNRHKQVNPEITKGLLLAQYVNAMIDLSDGLLMDLSRIIKASSKGAHINYEQIPVTSRIKEICIEKDWTEQDFVLGGGEDYVLLFTVSPEKEKHLRTQHPTLGYHLIGEINGNTGNLTVENNGKLIQTTRTGFDHFRD